MNRLLLALILMSSAAYAQPLASVIWVVASPSGACSNPTPLQFNQLTGQLYGCDAGTWAVISVGSTGPAGPAGTTTNGGVDCKDATGSTTAYTCPSPSPSPGSYATGMLVILVPQTTNTGTTPTLNVAGLGIKNLKAAAAINLTAGILVGGRPYIFEYDGTQFVIAGGSGGITALTGDGTATGPGSAALTLATVNSGSGVCGDATHVCQVTTNGKGLVTTQAQVSITGGGNMSTTGSPLNHQVGVFQSSTTMTGVPVGATDKPLVGVTSNDPAFSKLTLTNPATSATLTIPDGVTLTGPSASGTAATLGNNETFSGNKTFTGVLDASGATHTLPAKVGVAASKPATCTQGEMYFATDATAGQNWYYCTSTNTWTPQSSGSGGIVSLTTGSSDPAGACTVPSGSAFVLYSQTTTNTIWLCAANAVWQKILSTTGIGPYTLSAASGTYSTGVAASRPSCSASSYYLATDTHALTACDGTAWGSTLNPSGSIACIFNSTAGKAQCYNPDGSSADAGGGATVTTGTTAPAGTCTAGDLYVRTDMQQFYVCAATNVWRLSSYLSGTSGSIPTNCVAGQVYLATNTGAFSYCSTPGSPGTWSAVVTGTGTSPFSAGGSTVYQPGRFCATGTVAISGSNFVWNGNTSALSGMTSTSQEFTIATSVPSTTRYDRVMIAEVTQFASGSVTGLTASIGRPGSTTDVELLPQGPLMQSSGSVWFFTEIPQAPVLNGTYSIVVALRSVGGNISTLTAGSLAYEACGYAVQ